MRRRPALLPADTQSGWLPDGGLVTGSLNSSPEPGSPERSERTESERKPGELPFDRVSADGAVARRTEQPGQESERRARRPDFPKPPGGLSCHELERPGAERPTKSVITESRDESVEAIGSWIVETIAEICAHSINPVLGHLVSIAFKVKETWGDAEALASSDSGRDLHVPLLSLAPGVQIDLNVHLQGRDRASKGGPPVSGFIAPVVGDLFGGWAIESDKRPEVADQAVQSLDQDSQEQGR